jgi:hypothetical protein
MGFAATFRNVAIAPAVALRRLPYGNDAPRRTMFDNSRACCPGEYERSVR